MNLKSKIALIILAVFALYGVLDYGFYRFVVFQKFQELEHRQVRDDLQKAVHAFQREIGHLDSSCHDWASWDDTYSFAGDPSDEYIKSNLTISTF